MASPSSSSAGSGRSYQDGAQTESNALFYKAESGMIFTEEKVERDERSLLAKSAPWAIAVMSLMCLTLALSGAVTIQDLTSLTQKFATVTSGGSGGGASKDVLPFDPSVPIEPLIDETDESTTDVVEDFTFSVQSPGYDNIKSLAYLPWSYIAEPFKQQQIVLESMLDGSSVDSYNVVWTIDGTEYTGTSAYFELDKTGVLTDCTVSISPIDSSDSSLSSYSSTFSLASKYIRREIRTLTEDDRTKFFDTLYTLYTVESSAGKALYGDKFYSAEDLSYVHLNGAGTTDCDHWHDGAGIITHHAAFTLLAEQSLQAVDPSVSMPYWEYAMDADEYDEYTWVESPIFDADWFGQASPTTDDYRISDGGRWTDLEMPDGAKYADWSITDTGTLNPFVNAYGQMRSPWNANPSKYLGRHNQTYSTTSMLGRPTCQTMSECYASHSLAQMNDCMNGDTHGPVHILIGGAWGEGDTFDDVDVTVNDITFLQSIKKLLLFKMLWRAGWTRCPSTCSTDATEDCVCSVPQEYIDEYGYEYILEATGVLTASRMDVTNTTDVYYQAILEAIQDPGIAGEMFSSAAPFDPTFWPLHGSIERLVGYKRIGRSMGWTRPEEFDETWGYVTNNFYYLVGTCDWSNVSGQDDLTLPTCNMDSSYVCDGHNEDDVLEFSNFLDQGESYTNSEMYTFIHPWNDDLPYTYDMFDFDYCTDLGYTDLDFVNGRRR